MNAARIDIAPELIADWLCLPKGNRITGVWLHDNSPQTLTLRVEGPDMPKLGDGDLIPSITPTYRRIEHELVTLGVER